MAKYKFIGSAEQTFRTLGITVKPNDVIDFGSITPPGLDKVNGATVDGTPASALWSVTTDDAVLPVFSLDTGLVRKREPLRAGDIPALGYVAPPAASGTATLEAGTVDVEDDSITADSVIRIAGVTAGGTPGAVFVESQTAGTGFTITSTSDTDTSVVSYEIVSY